LQRDLGSLPAKHLELLVLKLVCGDKKLLKLILNRPRDVPDVLNSSLGMGAPGHGKQRSFRSALPRRPDALIVSGYETDVCVFATVLGAVDAPLSQPF
jgi:hypothetical protein